VPLVQMLLARYSINLDVPSSFPLVLVISVAGCLLGTFLTSRKTTPC